MHEPNPYTDIVQTFLNDLIFTTCLPSSSSEQSMSVHHSIEEMDEELRKLEDEIFREDLEITEHNDH